MYIHNISEALLSPPKGLEISTHIVISEQVPANSGLIKDLLKICPMIRNLSISNSSISILPDLGNCPSITHLTISAPIKKGASRLSNLPNLQYLQTFNWFASAYDELENLPASLSCLLIMKSQEEWSNLPKIKHWERLRHLSLNKFSFDKSSYNPLEMSKVKILELVNCQSNEFIKVLKGCTNLIFLRIIGGSKFNIADYQKKLPQLRTIEIESIPVVGLSEIEELKNCSWENLSLKSNTLTLDNLSFANKIPHLKELKLNGNRLTSANIFLTKTNFSYDISDLNIPDMKNKKPYILNKVGAAIAKTKLSQEDKEFFINYLVTRTKLDINKRWNWATILKATNISHVSFRRKLQTLIDEKTATATDDKNWSNAVIYLTGKPKTKVTELKNKIKELGLKYVRSYSKEVTHIIIGMNSPDYDLLVDEEFIPITETQIQQRYTEIQPQFLKETAVAEGGEEMIENLGKLLSSPDLASVKVGLEMIKSGGMPPNLFEELLLVQKTTSNNKIRKEVRQLLETEAPLEWKPFVRDRLSFKIVHSDKPESDIRRQVAAVAKRIKPTMAAKFSMMLYKHTGRGLRYALTARLAKGLKEEAYQLLLKDNHFDFSKGLGMTPLANREQDYYSMPTSSVSLPVLVLKMAPIYSLNLHNCLYYAVSPNIVEFKDLKHLDYSDNDLRTLPSHFADLKNLETVDLRNNMFRQFPEILLQMPNLKKIDLRISRADNKYEKIEIPAKFKEINPDCVVLL